jgi:hypothetical protein
MKEDRGVELGRFLDQLDDRLVVRARRNTCNKIAKTALEFSVVLPRTRLRERFGCAHKRVALGRPTKPTAAGSGGKGGERAAGQETHEE